MATRLRGNVLEHVPDFLSRADMVRMSDLWHLSRVALAGQLNGQCRRHDNELRVRWAAKQFQKENPDVDWLHAQHDFVECLEFGGLW